MGKHWLLVGIGLLTAVLAIAAIGCGDDDDDDRLDTATATEALDEPTEPADGETPADGEEPTDGGEPGAFTTLVVTEHATLGAILTTFDGYTVYTFDNDTEGVSNCGAGCVDLWPPLPTAAEPTGGESVSGTLGTITRDDGTIQVTYEGLPLYLHANDPSPGDANGDGFGGVWHVIAIP